MKSRCKAPMGVLLVPRELLNLSAVSPVHTYLKAGSLPKNKTNVMNEMKSTRQITLFTKPILKGARACGIAKESQAVSRCLLKLKS